MASAKPGVVHSVQVVNAQTHQTVEGIVQSLGVVLIPMARNRLATR